MRSLEQRKGDKIHTRNMEISTYDGGDNHIIVEGQLRDDRLVSTYHHISGKKRPPQNVHHMIVRMCIDCASLSIMEVYVDMPGVPNEECGKTAESLKKLEGIRIVPGFTSRVKKLLGGTRGCLHLTTLVLAMAPAIMQGFWAFRSRTQDADKISPEVVEKYLLNTCWVWRKEGPLAEQLFSSLSEKS
jgi:DUF2889 family protein